MVLNNFLYLCSSVSIHGFRQRRRFSSVIHEQLMQTNIMARESKSKRRIAPGVARIFQDMVIFRRWWIRLRRTIRVEPVLYRLFCPKIADHALGVASIKFTPHRAGSALHGTDAAPAAYLKTVHRRKQEAS